MALSAGIVSCGGHSSSQKVSGFAYRAFVSNPLFPSGAVSGPVLNVVNAANDRLSPTVVSLITTILQPNIMAAAPNLKYTLVYSPNGDTMVVIDNGTEAVGTMPGTTTTIPTIGLPGTTESFFIGTDNATAYAAVPNAPIAGGTPGAVAVMDITTGALTATIPVPNAHYVVGSPDGNTLLVFSDGSDAVTVISTSLIGTNENPVTALVSGFDRPVWAIFSGVTAYVFDCGAECGGSHAGISSYIVGSSAPSAPLPVSGASYGLLLGTTLFVAGTPPGTACGAGTAATSCGTLTMVDTSSMAVRGGPILITDGYHNRMQISGNGQLFVGARQCTNVNSPTEVRGCLSIYNTTNGNVVIPPALGDATGIEPVSGRNVVYVCQGGAFEIFDTTTDALAVQSPTPTIIVGQSFDVKLVDPPNLTGAINYREGSSLNW
jgi:hypothetical protein